MKHARIQEDLRNRTSFEVAERVPFVNYAFIMDHIMVSVGGQVRGNVRSQMQIREGLNGAL